MSKKVLSMVVALCMVLGLMSMLPTRAQAASTTAWQDAYVDVLKNPEKYNKDNSLYDGDNYNLYKEHANFSLRDIDNNGVPELIVNWGIGGTHSHFEVYTYDNEVKDCGYIASKSNPLIVSDDPKFPGLFYCSDAYYGSEIHRYATTKGNKLTDDIIWQTTGKPSSDGGERVVTININNETLVAEYRKQKQLPYYSISDFDIANINYNNVKTDGTKATRWYLDGTTWYYLNADGTMKKGWINDNGTWYYCDGSGAMLANTTVDGYILGDSGAWVR